MRLRWIVVAGLVVAAVLVATVMRDRTPLRSEYCVADVGDTKARLDLEQGRWSALMAAIAQRRGLPPRATTIAIATAYQESKIRNIDYGDRDSVGLFQQRPSQGWGTVEQISDPRYAIGEFYDALVKIDGYEDMAITKAAQKVQRSAYGGAYAQHESNARALASSLRGYSPADFTCQFNPSGSGSTTAVAEDVRLAFGDIDVDVRGDDASYPLAGGRADVEARGWAIAHYLVGNASTLRISAISFDGRAWSAERSFQGWVTYKAASPNAVRVSTD